VESFALSSGSQRQSPRSPNNWTWPPPLPDSRHGCFAPFPPQNPCVIRKVLPLTYPAPCSPFKSGGNPLLCITPLFRRLGLPEGQPGFWFAILVFFPRSEKALKFRTKRPYLWAARLDAACSGVPPYQPPFDFIFDTKIGLIEIFS